MNYERNRIYFTSEEPRANPLPIAIAAGVGLFVIGVLSGKVINCSVIGILIVVVGIILKILSAKGIKRPSDVEIEGQAVSMFHGMDAKAFKKLGIDPSEVSLAKPVKFWGYRFESPSVLGDEYNDRAIWIKGADGKDRSSEVTMTGFYFGEDSVYCYECTQSLVSDATKESTEEYFYKDVVSVKTDSSYIPQGGKRFRNEEFILTNMGGERRCCPVANAFEAEAAVGAFRALLKQKKI